MNTPLDPHRWRLIGDLVAHAAELPPQAQSDYLARACGSDGELRAEVNSLLRAHRNADGFLARPAADLVSGPAPGEAEVEADHIGERIGPYRIIAELGSGGMGKVYRASRDDGQFEKMVAIKLVRDGWNGAEIARHFRAERVILARLEHPNIARLIDGGMSERGTPYLVMDLVEGLPITDYCREHDLGVRERLELFLKVCSAVQCAHQNLVIHRDLKPGNILVTKDGEPKLLDFGIARLLATDTSDPARAETIASLRVLTPGYASPEQLRGEHVTTASDVYSLGVVLFELLTGAHPWPRGTARTDHAGQPGADEEPRKPSSAVRDARRLARELRGDLDNILRMALRADPARRYATVEQLAAEIRRHLAHLPVIARADTFGYRARKFLRRHRAAVVAASLVAVTAGVGVTLILRESAISRAERARAERALTEIRAETAESLSELYDAIGKLPRSAEARVLLVRRALDHLELLRRDSHGDPAVLDLVATGYERLALLQGEIRVPTGSLSASQRSYRAAIEVRNAIAAAAPGDDANLAKLVETLRNYALALQTTGQPAEAARTAERALRIAASLLARRPRDAAAALALARANESASYTFGGNGSDPSVRRIREGIGYCRAALAQLEQLVRTDPSPLLIAKLDTDRVQLAFLLGRDREFEAAREALNGIDLGKLSGHPLQPALLRAVLDRRIMIANRMRDDSAGLTAARALLSSTQAAVAAEPNQIAPKISLAIAQAYVDLFSARLGRLPAGAARLDQAITMVEQELQRDPQSSYYRRLIVGGESFRGELELLAGRPDAALAAYDRSMTLAQELAETDAGDLESRLSVVELHVANGVVLARAARLALARREFASAVEQGNALLRERPDDVETRYQVEVARRYLHTLDHCARAPCPAAAGFEVPPMVAG